MKSLDKNIDTSRGLQLMNFIEKLMLSTENFNLTYQKI